MLNKLMKFRYGNNQMITRTTIIISLKPLKSLSTKTAWVWVVVEYGEWSYC